MPPQLQYAHLTESNLKEHTKSFVDKNVLQEQFILDYVLEQQINHEKSQKSDKEYSPSSDSLSDYSRYSIEHGLPSINGSLLVPRSQLKKTKLSEVREEPHSQDRDTTNTRKEFSEKKRVNNKQRCGRPMKEKPLNINHVQKEGDQRNKKSKKKKKELLERNKREILKTDRRKTRRRNNSLLASSQIMQNWSSDKLGTNRVTLRSDNKSGLGIFNKGKASEKTKTKGVPDLVFSEIDFLNSNPSRKRRKQNEDDFGQRNRSSSREMAEFRKDEQNTTRNLAQDIDETSSLYDSVRCKGYRTSKKEQDKKISTSTSEEREKISNNRRYTKSKLKQNQSRIIHVGSKKASKASLSNSSHDLFDKKGISSKSNGSDASYSLIDKKTVYSPEHIICIDKTLQGEQNITSSYFTSEQKTKYADNKSQKRRSHSDDNAEKQTTASDQTLNDKFKQTERDDNPFLIQNVDSSPKFRSSAVYAEKQSTVGNRSQVDAVIPKCEELFSRQGKVTNNHIELDDDSKRLPIDKSAKKLQNDCVTSPEENNSEKMVICFDPTWIKQKSLLSNYSQSDNKNKTYQSLRLSHAVIAEGENIEQLCMNTGNTNNINTEFGNNDIVKNSEKTCQEIFAENNTMNVGLFDFRNAIQSNCQEVINENNNIDNLGTGFNKDCNQTILESNCVSHKSHYENSNELMYEGADKEFYAVDNQNFQDFNLYSISENNFQPFEDTQHWIRSHIEQNFIPQTSTLIQNQFSDSNFIPTQESGSVVTQNNKQTYITTDQSVHEDDSIGNCDSLDDEIDGRIHFVWKKHRLH